jgi:branched-chain amino acid transport system substrate-binding protein
MKQLFAIFTVMSALMFVPAHLAAENLRIGALFCFTGPAAFHSSLTYRSLEVAVDVINERGGLWGKKIEMVKGDSVDPKAAVSEVTRLITYEKVPLVIGNQSSPRAVPASEVCDRHKVIYWEVAAEAERLTGRNLNYVFRPFCRSSDKAKPPVDFILKKVAPTLKKDAKDLRIGVVFEQGDWGTDTGNAFMEQGKAQGLKFVIALSHDPTSLDFSSDIMRLKAAKLDFLLMPTTIEALSVFWRQAKELGFYVPGGVCGSGTFDGIHKLIKGSDVDYFLDSEAPWEINPKFLLPKQQASLKEFQKRWKARYNEDPTYVSYGGYNNGMVLFEDVLPRAGSLDPEAVRKAAMATDIPEGGTIAGYGVKFYPPGHPQQGQNERSWAVLAQYQNGKNVIVWPPRVQVAEPLIPMPSWEERAKKK